MKLTETIDECIKLVIDEIEGCDFYITEYEDRVGYANQVEKWREERKVWVEHLENLKHLKIKEFDDYEKL
jgi:predicted glycosyltransferase